MIPDIKQPILLVCNLGSEEEAMIRLSRVGYDGTIGFLEGGFDGWKKAGKEVDTVQRITAETFATIHEAEKRLIIDVRKKSEFDSQHVTDAINIPLNEINNHLATFPKDKPFVLHCAGGYRSMIAASMLKQRGWENFTDVIGGFSEIAKTGVPKSAYVCPTTML
jgi:rhodanese-related sulfurtransferase